jgi:tetratricopeptide (TPR) repeat protein
VPNPSFLPKRLVWLPFARPEAAHALATLERALAYVLETDPWVGYHLEFKNLNRQLPSLPPDTAFDTPDMHSALNELALLHKARWVMTGEMHVKWLPARSAGTPVERLTVVLRVYEPATQRYCLVTRWETDRFAPGQHYQETLMLTDNEFTRLVAQVRQAMAVLTQSFETTGLITGYLPYALAQTLAQLEASGTDRQDQSVVLGELIARHPTLGPLYWQQGKVFKALGHYSQAIESFQRAVALYPQGATLPCFLAEIWVEAGICHALNQQLRLAIACWQQAIELSPGRVGPYINIAHTFEELDALDEAEQYLLKAQALAPSDQRLYYNLARIYSRANDWQKTLSQYQLQVLIEPDDPWCYSNIAVCYLHLSQEAKARLFLQEAVRLDPYGEAGEYANLILLGLEMDSDLLSQVS